MPTSAQENELHGIQKTKQNSPTSTLKDKTKKFQDKVEGFLKQIVTILQF